MKTLVLLFAFLFGTAFAIAESEEDKDPEDHSDEMGRTYYEDGESVKEVFTYKEVQSFNPNKPEEGIQIEEVKDGAYFKYYENGQLKKMGTYNDGEKHGEFTYYDEEGNKVRTAHFEEGEEIEEVE